MPKLVRVKHSIKQCSHKALKSTKLILKPFYCEADTHSALETFKQSCQAITLYHEHLVVIPKYASKGRPKKEEQPEHYEYYWQLQPGMSIDTLTQRVERGFRFLKSPEFLSDSLFLKKPERIEAMLMIMTLCLMVYASLEYKVRFELEAQNKTFPNQLDQNVQNPTARWIFECFHEIQLVMIASFQQCFIANLLEHNHIILDLLGSRY